MAKVCSPLVCRRGMHAFLRLGRLLSFSTGLFFLSVPSAHTLPWNDDMYWKPELEAGTAAQAPAAQSVPTTGIEPPISSRITDRIKAGITLRNPVKATEQSIQNGEALYQIYCTPCHGPQGKGDGIMVGKVVPSSDLHTDRMKNQKDGYLYATIRSGGFIMPPYQHALSTQERWDIVNYVRQLQQDRQQLQQP